MADPWAIETVGLKKNYGGVEAVRGLDLQVPAGSIFGFLGCSASTQRRLVQASRSGAGPGSSRRTRSARLLLGRTERRRHGVDRHIHPARRQHPADLHQGRQVNCFSHGVKAAVGLCSLCQKGVCRECVAMDTPRLVCAGCLQWRESSGYRWGWYGYGFEIQIRHDHRRLAARARLQRLRPGDDAPARIARGIVAIGNIAVGGLAIGSIAVGGATIGFSYAIGGRV